MPLSSWSEDLVELLQRSNAAEPDEQVRTLSILSNAALVFTYLGAPETAKKICEAELFWIADRCDSLAEDETAHLLRLAIDPWVNLGRLLGFRGATESALEHFATVYSLNSGSEVFLGPCCFTQNIWRKILSIDPQMASVCRAVYVIDSLKAFFQVGDSRGSLKFIESLGSIDHAGVRALVNEGELIAAPQLGLHFLVNEGTLIAKSRLSLHDEVLTSTKDTPSGADLYYEAVLMLYRAESFYFARLPDGADISRRLAILVAWGIFESIPPTTMLRFIEKLGELLERTGQEELALGVYIKGLETARNINDQVYEWVFLKALLRSKISSMAQVEEWNRATCRLVATCEYGVVQKSENVACRSGSGSIHEELLDAVARVIGIDSISI